MPEKHKEIDFVVTWVDGNDPAWLEQKNMYEPSALEVGDDSVSRYRDWGLLPYLFRGIEVFAPWVRKVHFVTWGHLPVWLNAEHDKLNIVNHRDFIPEQYLPTFNSNALDWNLFRIKGLSERFVLFNDDMFLINKIENTDFFDPYPCGAPVLEPFFVTKGDWFYTPATNCALLNAHFSKKECISANRGKWFNAKYGAKNLFSTAAMNVFPKFYGFHCWHIPNAFLKSTFEEIWNAEQAMLDETCQNRFRTKTEPNQWLAEYWQYAKGEFCPRSPQFGEAFHLTESDGLIEEVCAYVKGQAGKVVCVNDAGIKESDLNSALPLITDAFESILPNKSSFEK